LSSNVKIIEEYDNYFPPVHVYGALQLLLRYVPREHLAGLHKITLTNSEHLRNRMKGKITLDKQRFRPADCQGLYHEGHVWLIMDKILQPYPELFLLIPFFKTLFIGEVLYHEIGHHIHRMEQPGFRDRREEVADEWKDKLMRTFGRQRYWYMAGIVKLLWPLLSRVQRKLDCALAEENAP
jgi:hypothetical protein